MTTSDYKKMLKQLKNKPAKLTKFKKHNTPLSRKYGKNINKCKRCGRAGAHISKYKINLCRQCFREMAKEIGFKKYG